MKAILGALVLLFSPLVYASSSSQDILDRHAHDSVLSATMAGGNIVEAYQLAIKLDGASTFYEPLVRLTVNDVNKTQKNVLDEDRKSIARIVRRMILRNLQYVLPTSNEVNVDLLERAGDMSSTRLKTVKVRSEIMDRLAFHGGTFFRCEFNYYTGVLTRQGSITNSYQGPDTQFCVQFYSQAVQARPLVVMIDLLSSRERFVTCRTNMGALSCYERSIEILSLHGVRSEKDTESVLSLIKDIRKYTTTLFKPFGIEFQTGAGEKLPIYCVSANLKFVRPSGFRTNCDL